jgi:molybdopterin synthase catalytic subunit
VGQAIAAVESDTAGAVVSFVGVVRITTTAKLLTGWAMSPIQPPIKS